MASHLTLTSSTHLQKLPQQPQLNPSATTAITAGGRLLWMWNPNPTGAPEDDDSWEVRAFAEDTSSAMGTTWPPRSYTCTFCRREFRSAQALGGHMNVHRRDRARLNQTWPSGSRNPNPNILFPGQEQVANGGLCLLYSLPNPNALFNSSTLKNFTNHPDPSPFLSISPHPTLPFAPHNTNASFCNSINTETEASASTINEVFKKKKKKSDSEAKEIDLELRLGRGSSPS